MRFSGNALKQRPRVYLMRAPTAVELTAATAFKENVRVAHVSRTLAYVFLRFSSDRVHIMIVALFSAAVMSKHMLPRNNFLVQHCATHRTRGAPDFPALLNPGYSTQAVQLFLLPFAGHFARPRTHINLVPTIGSPRPPRKFALCL